MAEDIVLYRVFIATPGGLEQERRAFKETLELYNVTDAMHRQAMFWPVGWEDTLEGVGRPQELINRELDKCDYFVMLLWDRWGTPPGGEQQYTSGTHEEYCLAMGRLNALKNPLKKLVVLFKAIDEKSLRDPGPQLQKVLDFKKELETSRRLLFSTFGDVAQFQDRLRRHLSEWLLAHERTSTTRVALRRARVPEVIEVSETYIAPGVKAVPEAGASAPASRLESKGKVVPRGKRAASVSD